MSLRKYIEKLKYREKHSIGHKEPYDQPLRPRSVVFKSKKGYNRQRERKQLKQDISEE